VLEQQWLRFLDLTRIHGPVRAVGIAARWLVCREFLVLFRDLTLPLPEVPTDQRLRWSTLTTDDIPEVRLLNPAVPVDEICGRLRAGQTGQLCRLDDTLAYYRWDATSPVELPYLGLTFRPQPGDYFTVDVFTQPSYRGRGIHSIGSLAALHRARELGCQRSLSVAAWWNTPSLRVHTLKAGRVEIGRVGFWSCGVGRLHFASGAVRLIKPEGRSSPTEFEVMPLRIFGS
jgi:hypothetical protein